MSYLWPQTTKVVSEHNGVLELTLANGRKVLDSKNANYSFGSLQRILERGLSEVDLTQVSSVLLLGLGGGSIVQSLRNSHDFKGQIEAVEFDETVIDIAREEFDIQPSENLHIAHADALEYVKRHSAVKDLIIVDLFIDNAVPLKFYSVEFCAELSRILSDFGSIVFNMGMDDDDEKKKVIEYFSPNPRYKCATLQKVEGTNTLLIVQSTAMSDTFE